MIFIGVVVVVWACVKSLGVNDIAARNNNTAVNLRKGFIFAPARDLVFKRHYCKDRGEAIH